MLRFVFISMLETSMLWLNSSRFVPKKIKLCVFGVKNLFCLKVEFVALFPNLKAEAELVLIVLFVKTLSLVSERFTAGAVVVLRMKFLKVLLFAVLKILRGDCVVLKIKPLSNVLLLELSKRIPKLREGLASIVMFSNVLNPDPPVEFIPTNPVTEELLKREMLKKELNFDRVLSKSVGVPVPKTVKFVLLMVLFLESARVSASTPSCVVSTVTLLSRLAFVVEMLIAPG